MRRVPPIRCILLAFAFCLPTLGLSAHAASIPDPTRVGADLPRATMRLPDSLAQNVLQEVAASADDAWSFEASEPSGTGDSADFPTPQVAAGSPPTWHELRSRSLLNTLNAVTRAPGTSFLCAVGGGQYGPTVGAIGPGPLVCRSWDNGVSWTISQPSFPTGPISDVAVTLKSVAFPTALKGWAVGSVGSDQVAAIWYTRDGGETWQLQYNTAATPGSKSFLDVCFVDSLRGWAAGAIDPGSNVAITATTDGGQTWHTQTTGVNQSVSQICFLDANVGFAVANWYYTLRTLDGGVTWTVAGMNSPPGQSFELLFLDPLTGFLAAAGALRRTTDGGATWSNVWSPGYGQFGVSFADSLHGFACGNYGSTGWTENGGATWQPGGFSYQSLRCCIALGATTGCVVGQNGLIACSTDSAVSWSQVDAPGYASGSFLQDVDFVDEQWGYVIGSPDEMLRTTDGGRSWTRLHVAPNASLTGASFSSPLDGWIAGAYQAWSTSDAGDHWQQRLTSDQSLSNVFALEGGHAWVTSSSGTVAVTSDSGASWQYPPTGTDQSLYGIWFANARQGWAVGWTGTIVHTADGGLSWSPQASGSGSPLYSVCFPDSLHGWAVGIGDAGGGIVLQTADGGATWTTQLTTALNLSGVSFYDRLHGCACGGNVGHSVIVCTKDGGVTWAESSLPAPQQKAMKIALASRYVGYSVGFDGRILKSTDLDVLPLAVPGGSDSGEPSLAILSLGPSPSRGAIRLAIRLADRSEAHVALLDIAGRRVLSRAIPEPGRGERTLELDSRALPLGVYFVRIEQGRRAVTRKITLLD